MLPETEEETDEVKSCAANPENRNLLTPVSFYNLSNGIFLSSESFT